MSETDIVARLRAVEVAVTTLQQFELEPGELAHAADILERQAADLSRMRAALRRLRVIAIPAGAGLARGNPDRNERVCEVLDIIDAALSPASKE